jgi:hypothetical protein
MGLLKFLFGKSRQEKTYRHNLAPTVHNANEPLTGDNLIKWHFDEFIKTLITLASPADRQIDIMGYGSVGCEMIEDFDWHYIKSKDDFIIKSLLTEKQTTILDGIIKIIGKHSGKPDDDFWDKKQLSSHADWLAIRQTAKEILQLLGKNNLELGVITTNENTKSDKGEDLIIQRIKTELIFKEISNKES